ncbi:MAG TPA: adenylate/guanylate cyclase domain-containing protein [Chitinophagaceae bacterium]|nr:adenylate/guanylate cyclase domain-containing protein [Chitinophagaceae bacterium]
MPGQSRQLAAIMFTDIVGYTALMGYDEKKAFELLKRNRDIQKPLIKHYNGIWIKELGDGVLASFHTVTDAVFCAAAIHQACIAVEGLQLRIGIHLGEVIFENNDVFGDGVNIASRLQAMASPGSTWVSEAVYKNLVNKKEITSEFVREETLKNVSEPVKVYEITVKEIPGYLPDNIKAYQKQSMTGKPVRKKTIYVAAFVILIGLIATYFFFFNKQTNQTAVNKANAEKSIAIIPFKNMSNDPQQEYFVEGMMDEILNHLYKIGGLNVISRTSSLAYKGSQKTSKEIANELGVGNLLEGSVQKDGDRIRIIVQLINGKTDQHLWAETYDREFKDVFSIQSDIAQQIAAALKVKIDPSVKERIEKKPTENTEAYNLYLLAVDPNEYPFDPNNPFKKNISLLETAIKLDSTFADAYAELALYWLYLGSHLGSLSSEEVLKNAEPLLQKALKLNPNLASAHSYLANMHLWYKWDFETVQNEYQKVLQLSPSNPELAGLFLDFLLAMGRPGEALNITTTAFAKDSSSPYNRMGLGLAYFYNNKSEEALQTLKPAASLFENDEWFLINYIKINLYSGEYKNAILSFEKYKTLLGSNLYPIVLGYAAVAYYKTGQIDSTEKFLNEIKARSEKSPVGSPSYFIAAVYTTMEKNDEAIKWLQKAYTDREVEMYWLKVEPLFSSLHNDPRFKELLKKIGFN